MTASELFIVDNTSSDWKVVRYLSEFCDISSRIDIATGYFEIGALLALSGQWEKVDKIRVLMGDEVSKRTARVIRQAFENVAKKLDDSIESEKLKNEFLDGVGSIVEALANGKIECRIFKRERFHAKAYITHSRLDVVGSSALVGSSNFTKPGLSENVELNVQNRGAEVGLLQEWYEEHWRQAEDCTPDILRVIDRHAREYKPFDVWLKALSEYLKGHETSIDVWEKHESKVFPMLAEYQQDGYHAMLKHAEKYSGAFLCDGVGLGKTFVGLMLIERFLLYKPNRKNVALFVPKAAREAVWEREIEKYIPHALAGFLPFRIFNHTDLHRDTLARDFESVKAEADVIIIDEAHHFRNRGKRSEEDEEKRSRYFRMLELTEGKQVFMLTATPINNRLLDLKHMIDLFAQEDDSYFKESLGIHSLNGFFKALDKELEEIITAREGETADDRIIDVNAATELVIKKDLFKELVTQRSRRYVKDSLAIKEQGDLLFPVRERPKVADYSVKKVYGNLLDMVEEAFSSENPLFVLSIYNPYLRFIGNEEEADPLAIGRQKQVVSLIRLGFLKRFESSAQAFEMSCRTLMLKLLAWIKIHAEDDDEKMRLDFWEQEHEDTIAHLAMTQRELFGEEEGVPEEDVIPPEFIDHALDRMLDPEQFSIKDIINDAYDDLNRLVVFLNETIKVTPAKDDKLQSLKKLLKTDPILKQQKVLIFSEFRATARYLQKQLDGSGIDRVEVVDSGTKTNRADLIQRFSPYYNASSSKDLESNNKQEIRVMISTDVLAEGLNLQDCTRLINYDIHWNPVRLMQRIGRIDRRLNPKIEDHIITDHPEQKDLRGTAAYWNFLPPGELDRLLQLHKRVANKTLRISKVLGVEGRKLLKPDDDFEDLRDFDEAFEGQNTVDEGLHLELMQMLTKHPEWEQWINDYPGRIFSGRTTPQAGTKGVFFCYALPRQKPDAAELDVDSEAERWTCDDGDTGWYFYNVATGEISVNPEAIANLVRSDEETLRHCTMAKEDLTAIRKNVEVNIKNTYLKQRNAPAGVKPELRCWLEIC
jgi:superfamily II DNA or RNA helicase